MTVTLLRQSAAAIFTEDELKQLRDFLDEYWYLCSDNLSLNKMRCFIDYYFEAY